MYTHMRAHIQQAFHHFRPNSLRCLLIGFYSPPTYSVSQVCCGQIGRLVVWLQAESMQAPPPHFLNSDTCVKGDIVCSLHAGTVRYRRHVWPAFVRLSQWSARQQSIVHVLFIENPMKYKTDMRSMMSIDTGGESHHIPLRALDV